MECTDRQTLPALPDGFMYFAKLKHLKQELVKYKMAIRLFYMSNKLFLPPNVQTAAVRKGAACGGKCALHFSRCGIPVVLITMCRG
jgi:hypothetical protein